MNAVGRARDTIAPTQLADGVARASDGQRAPELSRLGSPSPGLSFHTYDKKGTVKALIELFS